MVVKGTGNNIASLFDESGFFKEPVSSSSAWYNIMSENNSRVWWSIVDNNGVGAFMVVHSSSEASDLGMGNHVLNLGINSYNGGNYTVLLN